MNGFPQPPKSNRSGIRHSSGGTSNTATPATESPVFMPEVPKPPPIDTVNGRLNEDETMVILRSTLIPEHREDPNVLRFIAAYMRCRDARQAATEAGLDPRSGANLRARPDIHLTITKLTEKSVMKYGFDASEVIEKVKEIAYVDPIEFLNPDGTYKKSLHEISPEARRAIKRLKVKNTYETDPNGMKVHTGEIIEIELWDKMKATELLGREKEIFVEKKKVQHDVSENMASFLLESKRMADERFKQIRQAESPVMEITGRVVDDENEST